MLQCYTFPNFGKRCWKFNAEAPEILLDVSLPKYANVLELLEVANKLNLEYCPK